MRSPKKILLASMLLVTSLIVAASAAEAPDWKGRRIARGRVRGADGFPLPGARVTLRLDGVPGAGPTVETDLRGEWSYSGLARGEYLVTVEAAGYVTAEGPLEVDLVVTPSDVKLRRDDGFRGATGAAAPAADPATETPLEIGNRLLLAKDYAGARAAFTDALAGPSLDAARRASLEAAIAATWLDQGAGAEARAAFTAGLATTADPALRAVYLRQIARACLLEGDQAAARASLEKALAERPGDLEILGELADLLLDTGRLDEARPYLARLPDGRERGRDAARQAAMAAFAGGALESAAARFASLLADYPEESGAWYYLGVAQLRLHHPAEAKASLEKFLELAPDGPHRREAQLFLEGLD